MILTRLTIPELFSIYYLRVISCRGLATIGGVLTFTCDLDIYFSVSILFVKIAKKASKKNSSSFLEAVYK